MPMRLLVIFLLLSGAGAQQPGPRQQAAQATAELSAILKELLTAELKQGAEAAVRACSDSAQTVTEEFGRERGLSIRRVSLRYRNQKDQPDEWEEAKLRAWAELARAGKLPADDSETITENGRRYLRYLKPITVQGMCLACHGPADQLTAEVRAVLAERYPRDKATGYKAGDLRGAVSVLVPLP
jgi:hypothetical protein